MGTTIRSVARRSLSEAVFEQLREGIVSGAWEVGEALPSERVLCERFGVNRAALREALKRLQQLRLVAIRQGEPTRVLDFRETAGLELLVSMVFDGKGAVRWEVVRGFVEMRAALAPDIARLAAKRRSEAQRDAIREAQAELAALPREDVVARQRAHLRLWRLLVLASGNLAYRMAFNTMERAWTEVQDTFAAAFEDEVTYDDGYARLVDAVSRRRTRMAAEAAEELVSRNARRITALLEGVS